MPTPVCTMEQEYIYPQWSTAVDEEPEEQDIEEATEERSRSWSNTSRRYGDVRLAHDKQNRMHPDRLPFPDLSKSIRWWASTSWRSTRRCLDKTNCSCSTWWTGAHTTNKLHRSPPNIRLWFGRSSVRHG
eukprot:749659-Amphidinium_carterae.4